MRRSGFRWGTDNLSESNLKVQFAKDELCLHARIIIVSASKDGVVTYK